MDKFLVTSDKPKSLIKLTPNKLVGFMQFAGCFMIIAGGWIMEYPMHMNIWFVWSICFIALFVRFNVSILDTIETKLFRRRN